jgi:fatty-acyl-CoA synthase
MKPRSNAAVTEDRVRALATVQRLMEPEDAAHARVVHEHAAAHGDAPALIGAAEPLTYAALSARLNRTARWALAEGLAAGDVVALNLANAPDHAAIWLGLDQVGCVVALLNTHLAPDAMAHCIAVAGTRRTIDAAHLAARLPSYARSLFVRLCPALETTGTFRLRKADLAREGHAGSSDPVWRDDGTAFVACAAV